jgi:hypothetical protein
MEVRKWVAALLFAAVPIGVFGSASVAGASTVKPSDEAVKEAGDKFDFALWDELLHKYVDTKGRVDYKKLKASADDMKKLDKLYAQVGAQKLDALPSKNAKQAFMLNAYNVSVWKNVLMRLPDHKDLDGKLKQYNFFYSTKFIVGGKEINLKDLEDDGVRERFKDARNHFALNCASGGCPQLPNEAFTPDKLNAQLEREAKKFCNEERNVSYDAAAKKVKLSHIFDWYDKDFNKQQIAFINKYRASDKQIPTDAKIDFVDYDWRLNDTSLPR